MTHSPPSTPTSLSIPHHTLDHSLLDVCRAPMSIIPLLEPPGPPATYWHILQSTHPHTAHRTLSFLVAVAVYIRTLNP